jgi:hypothetical protein
MYDHLPIPDVRFDALRFDGESYDDILITIHKYLNFYSKIEKTISPYNAKRISINLPYIPPTRQQIIDTIGIKNIPKDINELNVNAMINSAIRFCERYKGKKQLPIPHHSTHHSIQFQKEQFEIEEFDKKEWQKLKQSKFEISNVYKINLYGLKPVYVENFKPKQYKYLILKQKLSKTGVPSINKFEVLLFKNNMNYIIDWLDADLNPRYVGII